MLGSPTVTRTNKSNHNNMRKIKNYKYLFVLSFFMVGMYFNVDNINANVSTSGGCELDSEGNSCMPWETSSGVEYICYADGGSYCGPDDVPKVSE